ncbi:MAG: hypothetical protein ABF535_02515 [Acetobacter sp.]
MKSYMWDDFVERQLSRLQAGAGNLDVYLSVDETSGSMGHIPWDKVLRTNQAEILALGLANRYEKGSLLWWNPDYTHYHVFETIPHYDYYLFIEYDACIRGGAARFMDAVYDAGIDNVLYTRTNMNEWMWTRFHKETYPRSICRGSLNCISVHSRHALEFLYARRREMSLSDTIPFWPLSEVFIPTELYLGGLSSMSLAEFGNVSRYDWFPPTFEKDLNMDQTDRLEFIHPVLDQNRYVRSLLKNTHFVKDYIVQGSPLKRELARFPGVVTKSDLARAALTRGVARVKERLGGY